MFKVFRGPNADSKTSSIFTSTFRLHDLVIIFSFVPHGKGPVKVVASDTMNGRWEQSFDVPGDHELISCLKCTP